MQRVKREISKEIYDRARQHNGFIASEDRADVWTWTEYMSYGVYQTGLLESDGKYYVEFDIGTSCD